MNPREKEFLRRLRATFEVEAAEHIGVMAAELLALEKLPPGQEPSRYETIFRTAHSLKGAARAVSARDVEILCQAMEGVFARWKRGEAHPDPAVFDVFHRALERLPGLIAALQSDAVPSPDAGVAETVARLQAMASGAVSPATPEPAASFAGERRSPDPAAPTPPPAPVPPPVPVPVSPAAAEDRSVATVRISVPKLDLLLRSAEELLALRQSARKRALELQIGRAHV